MKKNDHVEFSGKLPKELKNVKKKPIYGTIVKLIGKTKAEVKPRYKRFTVSVALTELTKVTEEQFTVKQKNPEGKPKAVAKKPAVKKSTPKKSTPKCETPAKLKEAVVKAKAEVIEKKPAVSTSKPKYIGGVDPAIPEAEPVIMKVHENGTMENVTPKDVPGDAPVKLYAEKNDSLIKEKEDPILNSEVPIDEGMTEYLDEQESHGGAVVWGLLAILAAVLIGAYYLFF
jgi:hypothetical protein